MRARTPFAIVQHGNQFLITDGYDNREGLSEILAGFAALCALHLRYRVPLNLHLSGTLLEAIAWHQPEFFACIARLREHDLLEWVGSSYAQNIMPLCSAEHNLRQLNEALALYEAHLGIAPREVQCCWLPERVWQRATLAPLLQSPALLNGGYRALLLDDRLCSAAGQAARDQRIARFHADGAGCHIAAERSAPCRIAGTQLMAVPLLHELRYCVPPRTPHAWALLAQIVGARTRAKRLYVYADDLEKSAGVGPWGARPWQPEQLAPYENFLRWLSGCDVLEPVLLSRWLAANPPRASRATADGTYYELAHTFGAGDDYRRWWRAPDFAPHRALLSAAEETVRAVPECASPLHALAWKQLLACSYETAWHDPDTSGARHPAPWAVALAAHARAVFVIVAALRWLRRRDGRAHAYAADLDRDGARELVLCNDHLFAVFTPRHGGRLVYLFDLTQQGALVVGNPADDWNWQAELNRSMLRPRNHPGAFAEVGHEDDGYLVRAICADDARARVSLVNATAHSALCGAEKTFTLGRDARVLHAAYSVPASALPLALDCCLSPDYLALLREGRCAVREFSSEHTRGWRHRAGSVYVRALAPHALAWQSVPAVAHGLVLRLGAHGRNFALELGVGAC